MKRKTSWNAKCHETQNVIKRKTWWNVFCPVSFFFTNCLDKFGQLVPKSWQLLAPVPKSCQLLRKNSARWSEGLIKTPFLSDPGVSGVWSLSHSLQHLTDVTLADEDINSILTDNAKQCKWCHLMTNFWTNLRQIRMHIQMIYKSDFNKYRTSEVDKTTLMQMAPSGGQIWN